MPIQSELAQFESLMTDQYSAIEGFGAMDIMWSIYFTIVPSWFSSTRDVVHSLIAIDLETAEILSENTFPLKFFNIQHNSLTHKLYAAAEDLNGMSAFYYMCEALNNTMLDENEIEITYYTVVCEPEFFGTLPKYMKHMYLANTAIEHHWDITWWTYKTYPSDDSSYMFEVWHDTREMVTRRAQSVTANRKCSACTKLPTKCEIALCSEIWTS